MNNNKYIKKTKTKTKIIICLVIILLLIISHRIYGDVKSYLSNYSRYNCDGYFINEMSKKIIQKIAASEGVYNFIDNDEEGTWSIRNCQWYYKNTPTCIAGGSPNTSIFGLPLFSASIILVDLNIADNSAKIHEKNNTIGEWYHQFKVLKLYVDLYNRLKYPPISQGMEREGEVWTIEDYLSNYEEFNKLSNNDKNFLNLMNSEKYKYGCYYFINKYDEIREYVNNNIIYQFDWSIPQWSYPVRER